MFGRVDPCGTVVVVSGGNTGSHGGVVTGGIGAGGVVVEGGGGGVGVGEELEVVDPGVVDVDEGTVVVVDDNAVVEVVVVDGGTSCSQSITTRPSPENTPSEPSSTTTETVVERTRVPLAGVDTPGALSMFRATTVF